jgi:hypothetical protein
MTLSTFPTFLTFLKQTLCFSAPASDPWQGPEIPPYPHRERLGPQTVGPEANDLTRRPESASKITMAPRRHLPDRRGHELLDFKQGGIRYTADVGRFEDGRLAEIFLKTARQMTAVAVNACDAAVTATLLLQHGCQVEPQEANGSWAGGRLSGRLRRWSRGSNRRAIWRSPPIRGPHGS